MKSDVSAASPTRRPVGSIVAAAAPCARTRASVGVVAQATATVAVASSSVWLVRSLLQTSVEPLMAIGVAAVWGYGVVAWLRLREGDERWLASAGTATPWRRVAYAVLLLPAYPITILIESKVGAVVGGTTGALASDTLMRSEWQAAPLAALVVIGVLVPTLQELLLRRLVLSELVASMGVVGGLLLSSALSAVVLVGSTPASAGWIPRIVGAFLLSLALGITRLGTGSWLAAAGLHAGYAVWHGVSVLFGDDPASRAGPLPVAYVASVVAGTWMLWPHGGLPGATAVVRATLDGERRAGAERWRWPTIGAALGVGLFVAEGVVLVRSLLDSFGGGGVAAQLVEGCLIYVSCGVALDLLAQTALPRRMARSGIARALPILAVAFAAERIIGSIALAAYWIVPLAALWAVMAHVRWASPLALAMLAAAAVGLGPSRPTVQGTSMASRMPPEGSPSFVIVVLDTVRRDRTSLYREDRRTTPNLETLAARGVRFDRAYATSCWSLPSHASLFTGLMPHAHGATFEHMFLDERSPTLAGVLAEHGYETAGFSANPYVTGASGMSRGFTSFADFWREPVLRRSVMALQLAAIVRRETPDKGGAAVVAAAVRWLRTRDASRPYLMFVNLMEAHAPYQDVPFAHAFTDARLSPRRLETIGLESHEAQWLGTSVADEDVSTTLDLMDGATASADEYLGQILDAVGEDPVVVVLSDHGDLVNEHGLFGHQTGLYEPLIRIPLVVAGRGVRRGIVSEGAVSIVDVMPTILSAAGIAAPASDGVSFAPVLAGGEIATDRPIFAEQFRNDSLLIWARARDEIARLRGRKAAVVSGRFKRIVSEDGWHANYDVESDPGEERAVAELANVPRLEPPIPLRTDPVPVAVDPARESALRALGYVE